VDFDGDGIADLLSGSYDPGELYWFKGLGRGQFGERRTICGRDGRPVKLEPDAKANWYSFGTWVDLVDWDDDGDLDLVFGGFSGEVKLRLNEGTRTAPLYSASNTRVQADGVDLDVPGDHGAIVAADWDGDGRFDLVLGSANGGVYWARNVGTRKEPKFEAPAVLVAPHDEKRSGYSEWRDVGAPLVPGIRAQIDVVDWDGDGRLDLLTGDFRSTVSPRADLTADEREELARLRRRHDGLAARLGELAKEVDAKSRAFTEQFTSEQMQTEEVQEKLRAHDEELRAEPYYHALSERTGDCWRQVESFLAVPEVKSQGDDKSTAHGCVWLHLRQN
jgi:hypothetical protein